MTQLFEPMITEMDQEAEATRRVLQRVPGDKLDWRPHRKSMTLGQLARHVATLVGDIAEIVERDSWDPTESGNSESDVSAISSEDLVPLLENSLDKAKTALRGMEDERATASWRMVAGDQTLMEMPRMACFRSFGLNHSVHHRAQLGLFLRLLDIPVPSTYGPSADENPLEDLVAP